ncbi:D-glycero-alpha-D-manno-heptose 1-phosphate guanylyltransferase [Rhodobiaceae bacterium]|nr:D-glycero-alpha-D-manno-heptose 1-phosphate guanylyltransferase [Rhodobiaceae bacterium]
MTQITRAMIMGAGHGTRMAPLTDDKPKPLVRFMGKPLIDHALARLSAAGVDEVVVNVHAHADLLEAHLKRVPTPKIVISDERNELLDTGGGVKKARPLLGDDPIITFNSDSVWIEGRRPTLTRMMEAWDPEHMDALLMIASATNTIGEVRRGDFTMEPDGRLVRREEQSVAPFMFAGVQIVNPTLFDEGPDGAFSTNLIWDKAIERGRLFGLRMEATWMHVGTPDDLADAERFLRDL